MEDEQIIKPGEIREKTEKKVEFKVTEYPTIEGNVEKSSLYRITGLRKDKIGVTGRDGNPARIQEGYGENITLWERLGLALKLLNHIFDPAFWQDHVKKQNYLTDDNKRVAELRQGIEKYNQLAQLYSNVDGQVLTESVVREIEATGENLQTIVEKLQK